MRGAMGRRVVLLGTGVGIVLHGLRRSREWLERAAGSSGAESGSEMAGEKERGDVEMNNEGIISSTTCSSKT